MRLPAPDASAAALAFHLKRGMFLAFAYSCLLCVHPATSTVSLLARPFLVRCTVPLVLRSLGWQLTFTIRKVGVYPKRRPPAPHRGAMFSFPAKWKTFGRRNEILTPRKSSLCVLAVEGRVAAENGA
eukprot:2317312-Pleurochrysis_carterae.AAC.1